MNPLRIKFDPMDSAIRAAIDAAVVYAIHRFRGELGDKEHIAHRIARDVAFNAMEHFTAWCNAELRLIKAEQDARMDRLTMRPRSVFMPKQEGGEG